MNSNPVIASLFNAARAVFVTTVIFGLLYPLVVWAASQVFFPLQAAGSSIEVEGRIVGSSLVGQHFEAPAYLWSRPSAAAIPYDPSVATGSNLAPTNPSWLARVDARVEALLIAHPEKVRVPVELVTTSASGLDPHLSPAAAKWQARRVARARGIDEATVVAIVDEHTSAPLLGIFGRPVVNVLEVNVALDVRYPAPRGR